jgi:hypothetical protein
VPLGSSTSANLDVRLQINDNAAITLTKTNQGTNGLDGRTRHVYSGTQTLSKGDSIRLYFYNNAIGSDYTFVWPANVLYDSYMTILALTVYPDTTAEAFFVHDAFQSVVSRIIGSDGKFNSNYFGSSLTKGKTYSSNGCAWHHVLLPGLQVRGYTLSEKQFSTSLDKLWKGANPIFNLGLGYEIINSTEQIIVENKAYFYDSNSNPSVYIDNVREITREYDESRMFKKIEIGYNKWESEDTGGLQDAQGKRTFATRLQKIGTDLTLYSDFVAAATALEVTRRQKPSKDKDYKYDNETFIIQLIKTPVSTNTYDPQTDNEFNAIFNLAGSDMKYNSLLTATRNLFRWLNYVTIGLDKYPTSSINFVSGEGNYDMIGDYDAANGLCLAITGNFVFENGNISLSTYGNIDNGTFRTKALHLPHLYTIEIDLSWDDYTAIRANRNKSIGISQTTTGHKKFFIKDLEYEICKSKCKMQVWPAEQFQIEIIS